MTIDITTRLLIELDTFMELDTFFTAATQEAGTWAYPTDLQLTPATRRRLETIQSCRSTLSNRQRSTGVVNPAEQNPRAQRPLTADHRPGYG